MEFAAWLNEQSQAIRELWHGTSEPLETLLQQGLEAQSAGGSRQVAVYLTDNPELAVDYARTDQDRTGNDTISLITIDVSKLDPKKLAPDLDHGEWDDEGNQIQTWIDSLRAFDQCAYRGNIPPSAFSDYRVIN